MRSNTVENPNSSGEAVKTAPNRNRKSKSGSVSVSVSVQLQAHAGPGYQQDPEDIQKPVRRFNIVDPI